MGREIRKTIRHGSETWAVHETVSEVEGAITPSFRTKAELIEYLVTKGTAWDEPWSRAAAEDFVNRTGWAPSFILTKDGVKKGYEQPGQGSDDKKRRKHERGQGRHQRGIACPTLQPGEEGGQTDRRANR